MADNKKPTGKKKNDPSPITEPLEGKPVEQSPAPENAPGKELEADLKQAWSRFKDGEAQFDVEAVPRDPERALQSALDALDKIEINNKIETILQDEADTLTEQVKELQASPYKKSLIEWKDALTKAVQNFEHLWQDVIEGMEFALENNLLIDSETMDFIESLNRATEAFTQSEFLKASIEEFKALEPYLQAELDKRGTTFDLLTPAELEEVEAAARAAMEADSGKAVPSVRSQKMEFFHLPLSKQHRDIFTNLNLSEADKDTVPGQLVFRNLELAVEKRGDKPRSVFYTVGITATLGKTKLSKALSPKEERAHDAIGSLYISGNSITTTQQLYLAMGNKGNINARQRKELINILKRIATGWVQTDQTQDYEDYTDKSKGKLGVLVEEQLLYFRIGEATINGKVVEDAIHILKMPILFQLALDRKQITPIPLEVIATGEPQTEDQIALENYLLDRISQIKNKSRKSSDKILYSSIYEKLEITGTTDSDRKKRQRIIKKMYKVLEFYKQKGWIKSYVEQKNTKGEPEVKITC